MISLQAFCHDTGAPILIADASVCDVYAVSLLTHLQQLGVAHNVRRGVRRRRALGLDHS